MIRFHFSAYKNKRNCIPAILIAAILGILGINNFFIKKTVTPSVGSLSHWVPVSPQSIENRLGLTGRIQGEREETFYSAFEGEVNTINVREGDTVTKGQPLLSINTEKFEIRLREAKTELLKAQQVMQIYHNWESSPEVSRMQRAVQLAKTTLTHTKSNLRDTQMLYKRGIVARMEIDTLQQQQQSQEQELLNAQEELQVIRARGKGDEMKMAEMSLNNSLSRYRILNMLLNKKDIYASFSGFVVRPVAKDGSQSAYIYSGMPVNQETPLLKVIGWDRINIISKIEENDLHQIQEGMPVKITGVGFSGYTLTGSIQSVSMQNDTSMQGVFYDVIISVDTFPDEFKNIIRSGMSAKISVITYHNDNAVIIPVDAIQKDKDGNQFALFRENDSATSVRMNMKNGVSVPQGIVMPEGKEGYVFIP